MESLTASEFPVPWSRSPRTRTLAYPAEEIPVVKNTRCWVPPRPLPSAPAGLNSWHSLLTAIDRKANCGPRRKLSKNPHSPSPETDDPRSVGEKITATGQMIVSVRAWRRTGAQAMRVALARPDEQLTEMCPDSGSASPGRRLPGRTPGDRAVSCALSHHRSGPSGRTGNHSIRLCSIGVVRHLVRCMGGRLADGL